MTGQFIGWAVPGSFLSCSNETLPSASSVDRRSNLGFLPQWSWRWSWWEMLILFWPNDVNCWDWSLFLLLLWNLKQRMTCFAFVFLHVAIQLSGCKQISLIPPIIVVAKEGWWILCVAIGAKITTGHNSGSGAPFLLQWRHMITFAPLCLVILTPIGD